MDTSQTNIDQLSNRELEILRALASGGTRQSISDQMQISINTYDSYRKSIRQKLRIKNQMDWGRVLMAVNNKNESNQNIVS